MRAMVRYLFRIVLLVLVLQAVAIALTITFAAPKTVDVNDSRKTIFQTDSKMAVYGSPLIAHASNRPQIVILGSSNTTMGLRPDRLQPYLGDVPIHNISVGSEKFLAMSQIIDLLYRQTPPQNRHNYIFVLGISYPLISEDAKRRASMHTSIDDELQRFGIFSHGGRSRVPDRWLPDALEAGWPFLVPKAVYNRLVRIFPEPYWFGLAEEVPFTAEESNVVQYNEQQHQERIAYYNSETLDPTGASTFAPLLDTVKRVSDAGGEVVIVDLPTAKWLQRATTHYAAYQRLRSAYLPQLEKIPHVRYINAEHGFSDEDFYDGIHPRNRVTPQIARIVAPTIQQALKDYP